MDFCRFRNRFYSKCNDYVNDGRYFLAFKWFFQIIKMKYFQNLVLPQIEKERVILFSVSSITYQMTSKTIYLTQTIYFQISNFCSLCTVSILEFRRCLLQFGIKILCDYSILLLLPLFHQIPNYLMTIGFSNTILIQYFAHTVAQETTKEGHTELKL